MQTDYDRRNVHSTVERVFASAYDIPWRRKLADARETEEINRIASEYLEEYRETI